MTVKRHLSEVQHALRFAILLYISECALLKLFSHKVYTHYFNFNSVYLTTKSDVYQCYQSCVINVGLFHNLRDCWDIPMPLLIYFLRKFTDSRELWDMVTL